MSSSSPPPSLSRLSLAHPPPSLTRHFTSLAEYVAQHATVEPSKPSFPAPQDLSDPDDPPIWPAWNKVVPPCLYPTGDDASPCDVYGEGGLLTHFEQHVANLFGKHDGLFLPTGTMAQQIVLKVHGRQRNSIFACHPKSHLLLHEDRAFEALLGFSCLQVGEAHRPITIKDVETAIGRHWKLPSTLILELPDRELGGQTITWKDLLAIREYASSKGLRMHLDGARIWEIQPYLKKSFQEIASLFDSIYISFYKGLGSTTGAMLLGSKEFITEARLWQHRFGGRMFETYPLVLAAEQSFNKHINTFEQRWKKLEEVVKKLMEVQQQFVETHLKDETNVLQRLRLQQQQQYQQQQQQLAKKSSTKSEESTTATSSSSSSDAATAVDSSTPFHPFFYFVPAVPQCSMVHMYIRAPLDVSNATRDAIRVSHHIELFHRLRVPSSATTTTASSSSSASSKVSPSESFFEWNMGPENLKIDTEIFVKGWSTFMEQRYQQLKEEMTKQ